MKTAMHGVALLLFSIVVGGCGAFHGPDTAPLPPQVVWLQVNKPVTYQSSKVYKFAASAKGPYKVALTRTGTANLTASSGETGKTTICVGGATTVHVSVSSGSGDIALSTPSTC